MFLLKFLDTRFAETALRLFCGYNGIFLRFCDKLQDRGSFFVDPGEEVYAGQIIAEHIKPGDLLVNAVEGKKLTNHRASGSDDANRIAPKILLTIEECMEYIEQDECIEVTPNFVRMRKIVLDEVLRKNAAKSMQIEAS